MEREQTMQQVLEILAKMNAKMHAWGEEMDTKTEAIHAETKAMRDKTVEANVNACRKETTACQEATETETNSGMMQSIEENQEIPKGESAVTPVGVPRKQRRVWNLAWSTARDGRKIPGEIVDPGGSWLSPAGRCPTVQKWHGEKETSSGEFGSWKSVNGKRSSPPPE
jgi:hypothetical protein